MSALVADICGVSLLGPGLPGWAQAQPILAGALPYQGAPLQAPAPQRLPAAERRRAGLAIKLAMAVAEEACADSGLDPATLATVFASSTGDGANCHTLCETLAGADRLVSPTRFTNSVHNATAGYWHIAVASRAASTSISAYDTTVAASLIEGLMQVGLAHQPVLLVVSDTPYPSPLHAARPLPESFAAGLVLAPVGTARARWRLQAQLTAKTVDTPCDEPALEALRTQVPAARALPLLQALARGRSAQVALAAQGSTSLQLKFSAL